MKQDRILIVGASGTVGSELSRLLTKEGYRVRATTSKNVAKPTDELVHINLATGEGIHDAFEGIDRAFLISPPGYADQHAMLSPLIQEAKRRGLKKVVLMTVMGANAHTDSPFRRAELDLEKSGLNYNIIRPNWFMQNFNTFWVHGINNQGKILLPAGAAKVSFIDARDISAVVAKLLVSDKFDRKDFDLTGAEAVTHTDAAKALSQVSKRNVEYNEITPQEFKNGLLQAGLPEDYIDYLVTIFGFLREGYSARATSSVLDITGVKPRTLEQYANDYKQTWIKQ